MKSLGWVTLAAFVTFATAHLVYGNENLGTARQAQRIFDGAKSTQRPGTNGIQPVSYESNDEKNQGSGHEEEEESYGEGRFSYKPFTEVWYGDNITKKEDKLREEKDGFFKLFGKALVSPVWGPVKFGFEMAGIFGFLGLAFFIVGFIPGIIIGAAFGGLVGALEGIGAFFEGIYRAFRQLFHGNVLGKNIFID